MSWSEQREWNEFVWLSISLANVSFPFKPMVLKTFIGQCTGYHGQNVVILLINYNFLEDKVFYSSLNPLIPSIDVVDTIGYLPKFLLLFSHMHRNPTGFKD